MLKRWFMVSTVSMCMGCSWGMLMYHDRDADVDDAAEPPLDTELQVDGTEEGVDIDVPDGVVPDSPVEDQPPVDGAEDVVTDDAPPEDVVPDEGVEAEAEVPPSCNPADCPLGCNLALDRCYFLDPSNFDPFTYHGDIGSGLTVGGGETVTVNGQDGSIRAATEVRPAGTPGGVANGIYWGLVTQPDGSTLAVFGLASLDLPAGSFIDVVGIYAVAFYVTGNVTLGGIIRARASGLNAGPGGGNGGTTNGSAGAVCGSDSNGKGGGEAGSGSNQIEAGGGGGGAGGTGGAGGDASYTPYFAAGGAGGNPAGNPQLIPLTGGCGGGAGGGPDTAGHGGLGGNGGYGGGGGGAVQISAAGQIVINPGGGILVAGAGGQGGLYGAGGGGGGGGGSILLEAAGIDNGGLLAAGGGGGGAGGQHTEYPESQGGQDGGFNMNQALGGVGGTYGGNGAAGGGGAIVNGTSAAAAANAGGGGGATGRIRLNYHVSITVGTCSPSTPSTSNAVTLW
jgi:hypothetical protein